MSRTQTGTERGYVSATAGHWCFAYLEVTDFGGAWINLGAISVGAATLNFVNTCTIADDIDRNTLSMSAVMHREIGGTSLVPFRTGTPVNTYSGGGYSPLLDLHRQWRIKAVILPRGTLPTGPSDYREMAAGSVDRIDVAGDPATITVQGRGKESDLIDAWIPNSTRTYGNDTTPVAIGTVLQTMLNDQFGTSVYTLTVDGSTPTFVMKAWTQEEDHLFSAMTDVAALAGTNIRYVYNASNVNTLTLFAPNRAPSTPNWSIAATEYEKLDLAISIDGVRNYIIVTYEDATLGVTTVISPGAQAGTVSATSGTATFSTSQAGVLVVGAMIVVDDVGYTVLTFNGTTGATLTGAPTFTAKQWRTSSSITRYGLRTMGIDLSASTQVTSSTAAAGLADAVRSDLESPTLEQQIVGTGLWFVQLNDYVQLVANNVHYDDDQFGGVTSYQHSFANGMLKTTVGLRGKPAGRYQSWLALGGTTGAVQTLPIVSSNSTTYYTVPSGSRNPVLTTTIRHNAVTLSLMLEYWADASPVSFTISIIPDVSGTTIQEFTLANADRGKVWSVRVTPFSGPVVSGACTGIPGEKTISTTNIPFQTPNTSTVLWDYSTPGAAIATTPTPTFVALTDGATITWATGGALTNNAKVTIAGNRTLSITGAVNGAEGYLEVTQDATGGRTLTLPSGTIVGSTTNISTTASKMTAIAWSYNGSSFTFVLARQG